MEFKNHIGERFGRLTIIGTKFNEKRNRTHVVCACDCGAVVEKEYTSLKKGKVQSCGCLARELYESMREARLEKEKEQLERKEQRELNQRAIAYINAFKKEYQQSRRKEYHNLKQRNKRLYFVWQNMRKRCDSPTCHKYQNYGARGISVCDEWKDFKVFCKWAKQNGYADGLSLDRIDNNGNYEPSNCRWADMKTQQNNKRTNCWLEKDGEVHTMAEWTRILNLSNHKFNWENKGFTRVDYEAGNQ